MNAKTLLAGTTIALALTAAAVRPASAALTNFATFTLVGTSDNFYYKGTSGTPTTAPGTFYSISSSSSKVEGPVDVTFAFIGEGSTLDTPVTALFNLTGTATGPVQSGLGEIGQETSATFSFTSTTAITVNGIYYAAGSDLLSGSYTDGELAGKNSTANIDIDNTSPDGLTLSSAFVTFVPGNDLDGSFTLTSLLPALADAKVGSYSFKTFKAGVSGQFGADPIPRVNGSVPEPASWALMMVGFGLAGASMRRRARVQTAA